jgi:PEGA domain
MKLQSKFAMAWLLLMVAFSFWACGSGSLQSIKSFDELEPVADLPQPTHDHNLVVQINNVADEGTSFKNRAELFINGKRIRLNEEDVGYQRDYCFHFRLKIGVYKIKAVYWAVSGGDKKEYKISTADEMVRIYPDQRTVLSITLDKKLNGQLKSKKNYFTETVEPLAADASQANLASDVELARAMQNSESDNRPMGAVSEKLKGASRSSVANNKVVMQISVNPPGSSIYIDGKLAGKSPLNVSVDHLVNHFVQLSYEGYHTQVKFVEAKDFAGKEVLAVKATLQPKK